MGAEFDGATAQGGWRWKVESWVVMAMAVSGLGEEEGRDGECGLVRCGMSGEEGVI